MLWQKRNLQVACLIVPVCFPFYKLFFETARLQDWFLLVCRNYEKNEGGFLNKNRKGKERRLPGINQIEIF